MLGLAVAVKKYGLCLPHKSSPALTSKVALKGNKIHLISPSHNYALFIYYSA